MTTTTIEHAIRRVISYMHINLGQDLTIDDMARTAMFSKFHFTRLFRETTGTSPGRFLSALRIQEAKRLLLDTDFSVADISSQVGYNSVGTFSSRFKSCVGLSPSVYRELRGQVKTLPSLTPGVTAKAQSLSLRGRVVRPLDSAPGPVFIGAFPSCVRQGRPARWAVLDDAGPFELRDVPQGSWHILAHSVPHAHESELFGQAGQDIVSVGRGGPVTVAPGVLLRPVEIALRPQDVVDPPVLLALLDRDAAPHRGMP